MRSPTVEEKRLLKAIRLEIDSCTDSEMRSHVILLALKYMIEEHITSDYTER